MRYIKYVMVLMLMFLFAGCCGNLEVTIVSPQDGDAFNVGEAITFSGSANFGAQPIADEMLVWTSDRDGAIGEGETFTRSDLSEGVHQITLTASRDEDNTCTESIQITIIILNPEFGEMTDTRDGQTYQTVKLGDQTWLGNNLNYETDNGSWCYDDDPANCEIFGRLYTWEAAMEACPAGWHLATDEEWSTLINYLDPKADQNSITESFVAGGRLKATGTMEDGTGPWKSPNEGATNISGFSAEAGGARYEDGTYIILGMHAIYWTSTEYDADSIWFRILDYGVPDIYRDHEGITKGMGISVRCVMD